MIMFSRMSTRILTGTAVLATAVALAAPTHADPVDELTNVDVAGQDTAAPFKPYKAVVPEPSSGGQGPNYGYTWDGTTLTYGTDSSTPPFDDGLSGSSRDMLTAAVAP